MGIISRLGVINPFKSLYHSPKPRSDVCCFKLNFNISKLGFSTVKMRSEHVHKSASPFFWAKHDKSVK